MSNPMRFDNDAAVFRAMALAAGVTAEELDAAPVCSGGCGAQVARRGDYCAVCTPKRLARDHADALVQAWSTVPYTLRWASFLDAKITSWVRDTAAVDKARELADDAEAHPFVTLLGDPGAGKTTLACAMLREWVRLGARPSSTAARRGRARRARYVSALDILRDRSESQLGQHVPSLDLAHHASVLVLDEVGRGSDPHSVIFGLVHERHRDGRPTIMTTPYLTASAFALATRDGGLARRVFDDSECIEVRKVAT